MSQKYNLSFILLVGTTILHLMLGAVTSDTLIVSWLISLLIPLHIAIKTRTSGLSKVVILCVAVLYIAIGGDFFYRIYYVRPAQQAKDKMEYEVRMEAYARKLVENELENRVITLDIENAEEREAAKEALIKERHLLLLKK